VDVIRQRRSVLDIIWFAVFSTIPMCAGMYYGLFRECVVSAREWRASFFNEDLRQLLHRDIPLLLIPSFIALAVLVAVLCLDFCILSRPRKRVPAVPSRRTPSLHQNSKKEEAKQDNWYMIRFVFISVTASLIGSIGLLGGIATGRDIFVNSLLALSAIAVVYVRIRHQLVWQWIHLSSDGDNRG